MIFSNDELHMILKRFYLQLISLKKRIFHVPLKIFFFNNSEKSSGRIFFHSQGPCARVSNDMNPVIKKKHLGVKLSEKRRFFGLTENVYQMFL